MFGAPAPASPSTTTRFRPASSQRVFPLHASTTGKDSSCCGKITSLLKNIIDIFASCDRSAGAHRNCQGEASMSKVIYEKDGRIGRVTLNRPEVLNAIDDELPGALADCVERANADPGV